ncbi:hypothetical protein CAter10_0448 [Collimonas arenae]|nr:hypothetical protein CAter10_0448 [Collimonas arenae]
MNGQSWDEKAPQAVHTQAPNSRGKFAFASIELRLHAQSKKCIISGVRRKF